MDALTAHFLEEQNDKDDFDEDIAFSDEDIPTEFAKLAPNKTNKSEHFGASLNRQTFLDTAPSMMRLISFGQISSNRLQKKRSNSVHFINYDDDNDDDNHEADTSFKRGHGQKGSIVEELLDSQMNAFANEFKDFDIQSLAKEAAHEFESLALQNDALYRAKESIQAKYEDQNEHISELMQQISDIDQYKEEIESLKSQNEQLQTEISLLEQEKNLYHEQIQHLNEETNTKNDMIADDINVDFNTDTITTNSTNNEYFQQEIQQLTQQKHALLLEIDQYKAQQQTISDLESKLKQSELEIKRLSDSINTQQTHYIQLEESQQIQMEALSQEMEQTTDSMMNEYATKEEEYIQSIENQQQLIEQLMKKNKKLDTERISLIATKSVKELNMMRMKTNTNIIATGSQSSQYIDEDPFNGNITPDSADSDEQQFDLQMISHNNDNDTEAIKQLQSHIHMLQKQVSQYEEEEQLSVQKLLDLSKIGERANDELKEQMTPNEYDDEEEEATDEEDQATDDQDVDEEHEIVDVEKLTQDLERITAERDSLDTKIKDITLQNEGLLLHVEEMDTMLENAHMEKETLKNQIQDMETSGAENNEINILRKEKETLTNLVDKLKIEYKILQADHETECKRFTEQKTNALKEEQERDRMLDDLQTQIMEYEELKVLEEESNTQRSKNHFNVDMVQSLNTTINNLESELSTKQEQLKQEKDAHFETLEKYTHLRQQMESIHLDLRKARTSSADIEYRSGSRIDQLELEVIDLNDALKDEEEKLEKSKSVIMTLRRESREYEEELGKLSEEIEEKEKEKREEMMQVAHVLQEEINVDDDIATQLVNMVKHIVQNKKEYKERMERLQYEKDEIKKLLEKEKNIKQSVIKCKINSIINTNKEMEELRKVIKSQQIEMIHNKNQSIVHDLWSWI